VAVEAAVPQVLMALVNQEVLECPVVEVVEVPQTTDPQDQQAPHPLVAPVVTTALQLEEELQEPQEQQEVVVVVAHHLQTQEQVAQAKPSGHFSLGLVVVEEVRVRVVSIRVPLRRRWIIRRVLVPKMLLLLMSTATARLIWC
jgi:hypothetical protein